MNIKNRHITQYNAQINGQCENSVKLSSLLPKLFALKIKVIVANISPNFSLPSTTVFPQAQSSRYIDCFRQATHYFS
jgi:hypothetical protein